MKIAYLVPGSGGTFYCENCVRDLGLIRALRELGHDVTAVPLYLPFSVDRLDVRPGTPLFFGGINVYLREKLGFFRRTPRWLGRLLDAEPLLRLAARCAGSVRARTLGATTLSMLRGEEGHQAKEFRRLAGWLAREEKPEIVHLSTALLVGLARSIRRELGVPVVCSLQDEHTWMQAMEEPFRSLCRQAMAERSADVAAFTAVSEYYGRAVRQELGLPAGDVHTVRIGLDPRDYPAADRSGPPAVGYLSRMSESLGLGILVEAFAALKREPRHRELRLRVSGGATADDRRFLSGVRRRLTSAGLDGCVDWEPAFDRPNRTAFLRSLTVLSVPNVEPLAFGVFALEAMACGVPVVQPRSGAMPELIDGAAGGVLYEPNDAGSLAGALDSLLSEPRRADELGRAGREAVATRFDSRTAARAMAAVYEAVR